ncbi:MAG: hypothetical protein ACM31C_16055 [Acidobacteriota bacterium]
METVKVDMQKLQLLNDRIAQTIEALNQLRLSVHGIQHTPSQMTPWGVPVSFGQSPWGQSPWGQPAFGQPAFGQPSFGQPGYGQSFASPYNVGFGGISHSSFEPTWWQTRQTMPTMPWIPTYPVSIY